jgi:hypothetical protein
MKVYLVTYSTGEYEDYRQFNLFATKSKTKAVKYANRFNRVFKEYKDFYEKFETEKYSFKWVKDEYKDYISRYIFLRELNDCCVEKIELR